MTQNDTKALAVISSFNLPSGIYEQAMCMRFAGSNCKDIGETLKVAHGTVRNWFSKGGLLEKPYQEFKASQMPKVKETANLILEKAKQDALIAYQRMNNLSAGANNEAVSYKANEFIIGLAGITTDNSLEGMLKKLTYEEAKEKIDAAFKVVYGKPLSPSLSELSDEERVERLQSFARVMRHFLKEHLETIRQQAENEVKLALKSHGFVDEAEVYKFSIPANEAQNGKE